MVQENAAENQSEIRPRPLSPSPVRFLVQSWIGNQPVGPLKKWAASPEVANLPASVSDTVRLWWEQMMMVDLAEALPMTPLMHVEGDELVLSYLCAISTNRRLTRSPQSPGCMVG